MVVGSDEFSEAMSINSIEFFVAPGGTNQVSFEEFYVYLGYCGSTELLPNYNDNYINGDKEEVFNRTSLVSFQASDPVIYFDTPFLYQPSQGNLVFEIGWVTGYDSFYVYHSPETANTLVYGDYGLEAGDLYKERPHILIHGTEQALDQTTFAGIKASF